MASGSWNEVATLVDFNLEIDRKRFFGMVDRQAKVLDFGCGYGRISNELVEAGYNDVTGIDPSYAMIGRGRKAFPGLPLLHSGGSALPFDETASTSTMSGETASRYRAFFRKPLNDAMHAKSA